MGIGGYVDYLPTAGEWGWIGLALLAAIGIYLAAVYLLRFLVRHSPIGTKVVNSCRVPWMFLLLELVALFATLSFKLPGEGNLIALQAIAVALILTIGWFLACIARGIFQAYRMKCVESDLSRKLTQALFVYRTVVNLLYVSTLASVLLIFPFIRHIGYGIFWSAAVYFIVIYCLKIIARKSQFWVNVINTSRLPLLLMLLEFAIYWSLRAFKFSEDANAVIFRFFMLIEIMTFGFFMASIVYGIFHHQKARLAETDDGRMLTQAVFLYRAIIIGVVLLTFGSLFLIFPHFKNLGMSILGSAGVIGIVVGVGAKPFISNLLSGFFLAFNKSVKIGDVLFIDGTYATVKTIHMTHVVLHTWDSKRIVMPVADFVEKSFVHADLVDNEIFGTVFLYCNHGVSVDDVRARCKELIEPSGYYNGTFWGVHVTKTDASSMELRVIMTSRNASDSFELQCFVREKIMNYLSHVE